jgi:glycosyltransferase involved in cell wall biosynthesis
VTLGLTACLIVHNEERVLRRCLDSIGGLVDDCCIVDTGSKDGTVDIARTFGARVRIERSLADSRGRLADFAAARNLALAMADDDWLLSIDADESLSASRPSLVSSLMTRRRLDAIEVQIVSANVRWYLPRIFRRQPWTRWHGRVHEWVEIRGATRRLASVRIENRPDKTGKESGTQRDLRLCRQQLEEDPANLRAVFYLARALRLAREYHAAIPLYERYWREAEFAAGRYTAAVGNAICRLLLHDFDGSRAWALRAYRLDPRLPDACCVLGDAALGVGRVKLSRGWFNRALEKRPLSASRFGHFVDLTCYREHPIARLALIDQILSGESELVSAEP